MKLTAATHLVIETHDKKVTIVTPPSLINHVPCTILTYGDREAAIAWAKNNRPDDYTTITVSMRKPVLCVTSGVTYASAGEACRLLGLDVSNMRKHLLRANGYASVKGLVFNHV